MARVIAPAPGSGAVPIRVWSSRPPPGALEQLQHIAEQPWVVEHVAAMPDLHVAHGVAVGTVFATERTLVPAALGGDLGCGVAAVRFDFPAAALSIRDRQSLLAALSERIPVGDASWRNHGPQVPDALTGPPLSTGALEHVRARLAHRHLGTLGGGNHFMELDRAGNGDLWVLVHSGSRGLGSAIAAHHVRAAEAVGTGALPGLALDSAEGIAARDDLAWAYRFARANRDAILSAATEAVFELTGVEPDGSSRLDVQHDWANEETHFGRPLWIHRKGAIAAPKGTRAVIPGSMGTASYVVEGLGEPTAFASGSHGAGRVMTRGRARREVSVRRLREVMRNVTFDARRERSLVEEGPSAYRDIGEVLEEERDLVRPLLRLEPIAVLKG